MGYTTDFDGEFECTPQLSEDHRKYLKAFASTRRMNRDTEKTKDRPDPLREKVGLPVGTQGEYFVNEGGHAGQKHSDDILNYNSPPITQSGLWCQWVPNENGTAIQWDYGEKFYYYTEWIEYIISNFMKPWGYKLNGEVKWRGEEWGDEGLIKIEDNEVRVGRPKYEYNFD